MTEVIDLHARSQVADAVTYRSVPPRAESALGYVLTAVVALSFAGMIFCAQAALFYQTFTPRVAEANRLLFDLVTEKSQRTLYQQIAAQVEELEGSGVSESQSRKLASAWNAFHDRFAAAPTEAIDELQAALPAADTGGAKLYDDVLRLKEMHVDRYKPLLEEFDDPPIYLWPTAKYLAGQSGYRDAMTLNRTLYLAQIGEIGTARVMLTGLRASVEEPQMQGLIYYMLARLQYELFRSRPEAEYYTQSVQYLRESLRADPDLQLAQRLIDYLLSLSRGEAASRVGEGRPTTPSEGQGAAVSGDKRRF
jgi:hypothetical protein